MPLTVILETHGKAVVAKGDTREIKEFLKAQGGKWNKGLCGWIFQGSKKGALLDALRGNAAVGSVEDRTGAASEASKPETKPAVTARVAESAAEAPPSKKARTAIVATDDGSTTADGKIVAITDTIRGSVNDFNGKFPLGVDLRKFYKDPSGEMKPAKGIRLAIDEWQALRAATADIDTAASASGEVVIKLGEETRVTIGGKLSGIDIRRFYVDRDNGAQLPTKKGILLSKTEWTSFRAAVDRINEAVAAMGGGSSQARIAVQERVTPPLAASSASVYLPAAATVDDAATSTEDLRKKLSSLLQGRDLSALSLKVVRGELEAALAIPAGGLDSRREEIKGIVTDLINTR